MCCVRRHLSNAYLIIFIVTVRYRHIKSIHLFTIHYVGGSQMMEIATECTKICHYLSLCNDTATVRTVRPEVNVDAGCNLCGFQ